MLIITPAVINHIANHGVTPREALEAFANHRGLVLETRPNHQRDYSVYYFVAETDHGRELKVVVADKTELDDLILVTAFNANDKWKANYEEAIKN